MEQKVSRGIPQATLNGQGRLPGGDTSQILVKGREQCIPQKREKQCRGLGKDIRKLRRGYRQSWTPQATGHSETRWRRVGQGCRVAMGVLKKKEPGRKVLDLVATVLLSPAVSLYTQPWAYPDVNDVIFSKSLSLMLSSLRLNWEGEAWRKKELWR